MTLPNTIIVRVKHVTRLTLSLLCAACSQHTPPATGPAHPAAAAPPLEAVATTQDIMRYEVDPSADAIWDSVGSITTDSGTVERQPRTDAEWAALRRDAV